MELLQLKNEIPVIDSLTMATGLGIQHKNLLETIKNYQEIIEVDFGLLTFETLPRIEGSHGGGDKTIVYLNENQALFIGTLSRNSTEVVLFKKKLVFEFSKMKHQLIKPLSTSKMLLQSAQALVELEERQDRIESKVDFLLEAREQSLEKLNYIERSIQEVPEISLKDKIRELVNSYAKSNNIPYPTVWKSIYEKLYYIFHFSVNAHKKLHDKESLLDVCERKNQLENLFAICSKELI